MGDLGSDRVRNSAPLQFGSTTKNASYEISTVKLMSLDERRKNISPQ
jgi:hypothetical protein